MYAYFFLYLGERESGRVSDANNGALNLHPKEEHSCYTETLIIVTI